MSVRLSVLCLLTLATLARGEERRTFAVSVDKKPAGSHEVVIRTADDGAVTVTSQADVTVKVAVLRFKYTFRGTEVWKGGRLRELATTADDNGKRHAVSAVADGDGLAVRADGRDFRVTGGPWPTTYWRLPPEKQRGPEVTLLDADTGKPIAAKLEKVGVEKVAVLGKPFDATHYRLSGGVQVDLWFDGDDRLVRQEFVEQGHRTVLELTRLQRE